MTATEQIKSPAPKSELYGIFAGVINQEAVQRLANAVSLATQNRIEEIHLAFHSSGGSVGDGICLYNLFRSAPVGITLYNLGSVASIGVVAYLGADQRIVSSTANFMIHRTAFSPISATSERLQSAADAAVLDDQRTEAIWAENLNLSDDKWQIHRAADLWLSAKEAVTCGLAHRIGDFEPPTEKPLFYFGPV